MRRSAKFGKAGFPVWPAPNSGDPPVAQDCKIPIYAIKGGNMPSLIRAFRTLLGLDPSAGELMHPHPHLQLNPQQPPHTHAQRTRTARSRGASSLGDGVEVRFFAPAPCAWAMATEVRS